MQSLLSYKYYDTPEGTDIFKKVFVTSKYATLAAVPAATLDVLMYSHPKGVFNTMHRYMWYVGPLVGMASAFTLTANVAQNVRGKNDHLNYFLGGVAAGAVYGAWQRSLTVGVPMAVVLGVAACIKKSAVDEGWTLFPEITPMANSIHSVRHDWTMAKDIEHLKTWTTGSK